MGESDCGEGARCVGFEPALGYAGHEYGRCLCAPTNGAACDPATDCGCDPGTTCRALDEPDTFGCFSLVGASVEPYASCSVDRQCPALHSCIHGVCKKHCDSLDDCSGEGAACIPPDASAGALGYCAHDCDPVSPTVSVAGLPACGSDAQCFPFDGVSSEGTEGFGLCTACSDACGAPNDICEDGGPSSADALCEPGTDCTDCGVF